MKKLTALLLALALLLTGCAAAQPLAKISSPSVKGESAAPAPALQAATEATAAAESQETLVSLDATQPQEITESSVTADPPAMPQSPATSLPSSPAVDPATPQTPAAPSSPTTTQPSVTKPTETTPTKPVETKPTQPETTQPSKPTGNTSSQSYPSPTDNTVLFFLESTQNIGVGQKVRAKYVYNGSGKLTWYVSHPIGISVDQGGVITPHYEGNYRVYVTDGKYTAVTEVWAPLTWYGSPHSMYFETTSMELTVGKSKLIPVTDGTSFGATSYSSSDPSVAKISGTYITAVSPGTAIITAYRYGCTAKMVVTVVPETVTVSLDITESSVSLYDDETVQLHHKYTGAGVLEWSSSNTYVARVDENGLVTAVGEGSCYIYLSDGAYADQCAVTVSIDPNVKVTKLTLTSSNGIFYDGVTRYKGDYITFKVSVAPSNASRATYITVSDPSVISVSKTYSGSDTTFRLDFKKAGTCVVKIVSGDNAVTNTYTVHVKGDYACNPGSGVLTPAQFVNAYNGVLNANGMSQDYMPTGYLVLTLDPDELTWKTARKCAEGLSHHWWSIGYRHMIVTYEGTNEYGQHIFYERGC